MKSEVEVFHKYNTVVKMFPDGQMEITFYKSDNLRKKEEGYEKIEESKEEYKDLYYGVNSDHNIRPDSLHRSMVQLIDLAKANRSEWKSFVTLTFEENIEDINVANKFFHNWCKQIRRIFPEFMYLGVPEYQKRGAVHYHIITNISCGSDIIPKMPRLRLYSYKKEKYYNIDYYDVKYWKRGFSSVFDIIRETDSDFKLELYLTKYMFADKDGNRNVDNRLWGHNKILHSNNLKKPVKHYYNLTDEEYKKLLELYEDRINEKKELHSSKKFVPDRDITTIN